MFNLINIGDGDLKGKHGASIFWFEEGRLGVDALDGFVGECGCVSGCRGAVELVVLGL